MSAFKALSVFTKTPYPYRLRSAEQLSFQIGTRAPEIPRQQLHHLQLKEHPADGCRCCCTSRSHSRKLAHVLTRDGAAKRIKICLCSTRCRSAQLSNLSTVNPLMEIDPLRRAFSIIRGWRLAFVRRCCDLIVDVCRCLSQSAKRHSLYPRLRHTLSNPVE